jgi:hypothetical protein
MIGLYHLRPHLGNRQNPFTGGDNYPDTGGDRHPHQCGFQARFILRLKEHYHCEDIHAALLHAARYYAFDAKTVERILKARFCPRPLEFISARSVSQSLALLPEVKQRPLEEYGALFKEA